MRDAAAREQVADCVYAAENVRGAALVVAIVVGAKGPTAFDAGRAAQNMMLAASNGGVGSCPNGIADAARLRAALAHAEDEQVATVLTFGYPAKPGRDPQSLSPEEWVVRADRRRVRGHRHRALAPILRESCTTSGSARPRHHSGRRARRLSQAAAGRGVPRSPSVSANAHL